jgi:hypothetical protein
MGKSFLWGGSGRGMEAGMRSRYCVLAVSSGRREGAEGGPGRGGARDAVTWR